MAIKKIKIENFKCFNGVFELELNKGLNILVGNNETGKSTIVEAIPKTHMIINLKHDICEFIKYEKGTI